MMHICLQRVGAIFATYLGITTIVLFCSGLSAHHRMVDPGQQTDVPAAIYGKQIWQHYNCGVCHSVFGLGGHLGPDLTNVSNRRDDTYINHILSNGFGKMPENGNLTDDEKTALISYFSYLNTLGDYPLQSPWSQAFGNPHD